MKENIKLFFVYIFYGIAIGCTFFVSMCLSYSLFEEEHLAAIFKDFTRQSLGAVLVGIACGSTAIVYRFERPSYLFSCCIFFLIRFCFYLFSKNEAKKINKKLRELEKGKEKI